MNIEEQAAQAAAWKMQNFRCRRPWICWQTWRSSCP